MQDWPEVTIEWWFAARTALTSMHWRDASDVDEAVLKFAATGKGRVTKVKTDTWGLWLHVRGYKVRLRLDPRRLVLGVLYIWRQA